MYSSQIPYRSFVSNGRPFVIALFLFPNYNFFSLTFSQKRFSRFLNFQILLMEKFVRHFLGRQFRSWDIRFDVFACSQLSSKSIKYRTLTFSGMEQSLRLQCYLHIRMSTVTSGRLRRKQKNIFFFTFFKNIFYLITRYIETL